MRKNAPYRISLIAILLIVSARAAYAGFVWTPPPTPPPSAAAATNGPVMPAAPVTPVDSGGMDALPLPGASPNTKPDNLASFLPPGPVGGAGDYIDVQGFGKDLPLHIVAKQVVPSGYAISYAPGVDTDTPVSWNGGKPWNAVLQDALTPMGLQAAINGKSVTIQQMGSAPVVAAPSPPTPPPAPAMDNGATGAPTPLATNNTPPAPSTGTADDIHWNAPPAHDAPAPLMAAAMPMPDATTTADAGMSAPPTPDATADATPPAPPVGMKPGDISSAPVDAPVAKTTESSSSPAAMEPTPLAPPANDMSAAIVTPPPAESVPSAITPPVAAAPETPATIPAAPPAAEQQMAADTPAPAPVDNPVMDSGPAPDLTSVDRWRAAKGDDLHTVLSDWCARAGVTLVWQADQDYQLHRALDIHGNFPEAVRRLLTAYNNSNPRPTGALHPHLPNGQAVLIISTPSGSDAS